MIMRALFSILICFSFVSCASVTDGTLESKSLIMFSSTPSNAEVIVNGSTVCRTPCQYRTPRYFLKAISLVADDGSVVDIDVSSEFNAAILGNVIAGGGVGLVLDGVTGRATVARDRVHVNFDSD